MLVYQPQVNKWDGNRIDFRAALAIKPTGAKDETFGVIFATARTQVDKVARTVVFEDMKISKIDFPTLPEPRRGVRAPSCRRNSPPSVRTIALDRLQASLALAGVKPPTVAGAEQSAAGARQLLAGDPGADRRRAGASSRCPAQPRFKRVINTRALILQGGLGDKFYIHVYDGWLDVERDHRAVDAAVPRPSMPGMNDDRARSSRRRASSTCSTAVRRPIPSPRSPTACRRSTRARCRPS